MTITGGTIDGYSGIYNNGELTITGGTISGKLMGINNYSTGVVDISGSSTQVSSTTLNTLIPTNSAIANLGTVTISNGTFTALNYCIYNDANGTKYGNTTVTGGTFTGGTGGAYIKANTTLTIGTEDATTSTSIPTIQASNTTNAYGLNIVSNGIVNFYDGIIKSSSGTGYSINGTVTDTPDDYFIYKETVSGVENAFLIKPGLLMEGDDGNASTNYLRTTISKSNIESITFVDSITGHTPNGTNCWDVSEEENGSVLAWATDLNNNSKYELTIGQYGGVIEYSGFYQFANLENLNSINGLNYLDTSSVTNMNLMFFSTGKNSTSFTLDLGNNFNTSNVTTMESMFSYTGFTNTSFTLNLGNHFNTSKVTNMNAMFAVTGYNSTVFTLNLGNNFDTSKVTGMNYMFYNTGYSSTSFALDLGSKFDTSNVTSMEAMFSLAGHSKTGFVLNLGEKFDTSNVTNMSYMFNGCSSLTTIYASLTFTTTSVSESGNMFEGCTSLVGGSGTVYNASYVDKTRAKIDGGTSNPGYFTSPPLSNLSNSINNGANSINNILNNH